jgi:DNA-binding transcriptional MerR regulator
MRTLLQIGEVAQLLGVTPKTIRHYQKVGLLNEPERTEAGYRLYDAHDLLRLQRVRRLQALGLSLKQIKIVPGEPDHERTLREVLQSLDQELAGQIHALEERRERIQALLNEKSLAGIEQPAEPFGIELAKELLGERFYQISPEVLEMEAKMWAPIESFNWPGEYREGVLRMMEYFAQQPQIYDVLLPFSEKFASLASLPEDAPQVEQLLEDCAHNSDFQLFMHDTEIMLAFSPQMENQFGEILGNLLSTSLSPAQRRFSEIASQRIFMAKKDA